MMKFVPEWVRTSDPVMCCQSVLNRVYYMYVIFYLFLLPRPRRGLRGIVFTRSVCLSVCVSVCLSVCVSGQYFGILFLIY